MEDLPQPEGLGIEQEAVLRALDVDDPQECRTDHTSGVRRLEQEVEVPGGAHLFLRPDPQEGGSPEDEAVLLR